MSDLKATLERLYALIPRGRKLGLERMQAACAHFNNPERSFGVVHVAGTNGKGTVCSFVEAMAVAGKKKVGLFSSPHLSQFAERIRINGECVDEQTLTTLLNRVMDEAPDLTFFEVATLTAFLAFQQAGVELAILEVGLGGRLDATNVVPPPAIAAITRIAFDHMAELGDTLHKIALEKAGIIKPTSKVVLGKLHPEAREAILGQINEVGAELVELGSPEPIPGAPLAYPRVAMVGSNLAVAVTIARQLGIPNEQIAEGVENVNLPGRNELLHRNGQELTLLDCAHNPDGAVALSHSLDPSILGDIESRREVALVFGAINTKNWKAMLKRLEQVALHRVYVAPPISKAVNPRDMLQVLPGEAADSIEAALNRARALVGPRGIVVVTGSTFLVGAARALLLGLPSDPVVDL